MASLVEMSMNQVLHSMLFGVWIFGIAIHCACFCLDKAKAIIAKMDLQKMEKEEVVERFELEAHEVGVKKGGEEKVEEKEGPEAENLTEGKDLVKAEDLVITEDKMPKTQAKADAETAGGNWLPLLPLLPLHHSNEVVFGEIMAVKKTGELKSEVAQPKAEDTVPQAKAQADFETDDENWLLLLPLHHSDKDAFDKTITAKVTNESKPEIAQPKAEDQVSEEPEVESSDHGISPMEPPRDLTVPSLEGIQNAFGELVQILHSLLSESEVCAQESQFSKPKPEIFDGKVPGAGQQYGETVKTIAEKLKTLENPGLNIMSNSPELGSEFEFPDISIAFPGSSLINEDIIEKPKVPKQVVSCGDLKPESIESKTDVTAVAHSSEAEVAVEVKVVREAELVESNNPTAEESMKMCDKKIKPMAALVKVADGMPKVAQDIRQAEGAGEKVE
ncbi:hypothetical protein BZA77DRAFT_384020 [Pyronema omphalodes]|nr:hypothetical protein BZA77DRAFT_384020 [Pyronema omphalodes]